jgi:tRNA-splicing ligase RtcB
MRELRTEALPIKMWLDEIEEGALAQAKNIARLPGAFGHIAIMADAHQGFGMPIGGVLATLGEVVPNAVGVDVGCGMVAVRSDLREIEREALRDLVKRIRARIPLGFSHHRSPQQWEGFERAPDIPVVQRELDSARFQLGSLGGGNHFIEVQRGDDGFIWLMLHSGSRNFGYTIAREFAARARRESERRGLALPDPQLGMFSLDSREGRDYLAAMDFAQEFAAASRARMMELVRQAVRELYPQARFPEEVNIHHNFAALEEHFGRELVIHRKGATAAEKGRRGIIPGSQGSPSYIVRGLGNPESFRSCSHGAGRVMGRKAAQRQLDLDAERGRLEREGILHSLRSRKDLDEAAGAYKDIQKVMRLQQDLVEIEVQLQPLAVVKA